MTKVAQPPPDAGQDPLHPLRGSAFETSHSVLALQRGAEQSLLEAKRALEAQAGDLAATVSLLNATLDSSLDGIVVADLRHRMVTCNSRFTAMWQVPQALVQHGNADALTAHIAAQLRHPERFLRRALTLWADPQSVGTDLVERLDGRFFERTVAPHMLGGQCVGIVINWRDVTAQHQAAQLQTAKEAVELASRAKSEFMSRMSHELRTPLNAILGFSQLLGFDPAVQGSTSSQTKVSQIYNAGCHLLALVEDILDIARIEAGELGLTMEDLEAGGLIDETIGLVAPQAQMRRIAMSRSGATGPIRLQADRRRLRQVLVNLLSNATKYNREGGRVTVEARIDGQHTCITVEDTGPGLTPAQMDGLFEPFNRLGAERSGMEGTGLGLAITKQLVLAMDGVITVTSEADRGTRFTLWFNRLPAGHPAGQPGH